MFVVDAFLENLDRHNGNWGYLVEAKTVQTTNATIFDCGSCLLSQAVDNIMNKINANIEKLQRKITQEKGFLT